MRWAHQYLDLVVMFAWWRNGILQIVRPSNTQKLCKAFKRRRVKNQAQFWSICRKILPPCQLLDLNKDKLHKTYQHSNVSLRQYGDIWQQSLNHSRKWRYPLPMPMKLWSVLLSCRNIPVANMQLKARANCHSLYSSRANFEWDYSSEIISSCGFDLADLVFRIGYDLVEYSLKTMESPHGNSIIHIGLQLKLIVAIFPSL